MALSVIGMIFLAQWARLHLIDIQYDSTRFQFWGSEEYRKGIPLYSDTSFLIDRQKSLFGPIDMLLFMRRARVLNREKRSDQAPFYFAKMA